MPSVTLYIRRSLWSKLERLMSETKKGYGELINDILEREIDKYLQTQVS